MMKKRIAGLWWVSDKPDKKIAGDLLIDDRKLELTGSFEGFRLGIYGGGVPKLRKTERQTTIQGVARNGGTKYTLEYFADPIGFQIHDYKADTYRLGDIFVGGHFNKMEDLSFSEYYIEFPYLYEWVNDSVITIDANIQPQPLKWESVTITVSNSKIIEFYEDEMLSYRL